MSESPTEHFEHMEHAEHVAHEGDPFMSTVAMTIAVLAVIAASVGSLESVETAATITSKNESVLYQNKASDQWAFLSGQEHQEKHVRDRRRDEPGQGVDARRGRQEE